MKIDHIILSDAGLISAWSEKMAHQRTQQMKQCPPGHLCYIPYPKFDSSRSWFGNQKCQVAPVSMGGILSINNIGARHTCNRIINAFEEAIVVVQETQCPCVLTRKWFWHICRKVIQNCSLPLWNHNLFYLIFWFSLFYLQYLWSFLIFRWIR